MDPLDLDKALSGILCQHKDLLSSISSNEDAAVSFINDDFAIVQTLDFITPIVDDPYIFGQIAAANSLSDVFAMGGDIINALNIIGFDKCNFSPEVLREIIEGGAEKIRESGGFLAGGHTIESQENFYGLSVTGKVHPKKFWSNNTPKNGDILVLTKPLGIGIISTSIKAKIATMDEILQACKIMSELNLKSSLLMRNFDVHACTDITGFGLLGHICEMVGNKFDFELFVEDIPVLGSAIKYCKMGLIPNGAYNNQKFIQTKISQKYYDNILLCDPQTSGGLLFSIPENQAYQSIQILKDNGIEYATIIGLIKIKK